MAKQARKPVMTIELTPEQRQQIRQATGREVTALALAPEELEERAAPLLLPAVQAAREAAR